jgi:hypothetical protein
MFYQPPQVQRQLNEDGNDENECVFWTTTIREEVQVNASEYHSIFKFPI